MQQSPATLPPQRGHRLADRSPPREPTQKSSPEPQPLPSVRGPAAPHPSQFPTLVISKCPSRNHRRLRPVPPLPARAGTSHAGDPGELRRGGLPLPRTLPHPQRGHPAGDTRTVPQELAKLGLGQHMGRTLATGRDHKAHSSLKLLDKRNKATKAIKKVSVLLTTRLASLSPALLPSPLPTAVPTASSQGCWA